MDRMLKFCIIDMDYVMHGSYNLTSTANNNDETLATALDYELVIKFAKEFRNYIMVFIFKQRKIRNLREVFMSFLNYNKDEKLEFNYKRACGLWLIVVAVIISLATLIGGKQIINMQLFCIGYVISFFSVNMNKKVLNKLSNGSSSKFQDKVSLYAIILLFVLMVFLGGPFFATENWRLIWLGALMATALHFFPYYFVHGKSMIYLGIICTINIAVAYIFTNISLVLVAYIDAAIKFVFGVYLLFFSKP